MNTVWTQRREELLSDCIVSPNVFNPIVERLGDFVVPYQHAQETEAGQPNVHLYLQRLLSQSSLQGSKSDATQECQGDCGVSLCPATGQAGVHRHSAIESSPVGSRETALKGENAMGWTHFPV